jgi:uncharacterized membrane protein
MDGRFASTVTQLLRKPRTGLCALVNRVRFALLSTVWLLGGVIVLHDIFILTNNFSFFRMTTGLLMVCFVPGYIFLSCLYYPWKDTYSALEHVVLSLPLSMSINTLIGLCLNQFQIGANTIYYSYWLSIFLVGLITVSSLIIRKPFKSNVTSVIGSIAAALFFSLVISLLPITTSGPGNNLGLTFYVTNTDHQIDSLPYNVSIGQPITVMIGGTYAGRENLQVQLQSSLGMEETLTLIPGQIWEKPQEILINTPGVYGVSWRLLLPGEQVPLRAVQIWVRVQ